LDAAMKLFSQYGYRRTSIDDIAREAEIAKGTVYLSFKSKEEIFRALCESLIERTESAVKLARENSGPIDERLVAMLEAKFGLLFETVYRSAHAAELMDSKNRLSADLFTQSGRRYMKVLRDVIEDATRSGELSPSQMELDADDLAQMLVAAAHGVESNATSPAQYHRRLREIVRVIVGGVAGAAGRSSGRAAPSPTTAERSASSPVK
jgi:AcrR family transcriptional regulator